MEKSAEKSSESPQKGRKKAQPSPVGLKSAIRFALRKYFCDVRKRKKDADLGDWKPIPNENPKHGVEEKLPDHEDKEEHLFLRFFKKYLIYFFFVGMTQDYRTNSATTSNSVCISRINLRIFCIPSPISMFSHCCSH